MITIIADMSYSSGIKFSAEKFSAICLIILISISLLISNTKYRNKYNSNTINMSIFPMILTFIAIVIFEILKII